MTQQVKKKLNDSWGMRCSLHNDGCLLCERCSRTAKEYA